MNIIKKKIAILVLGKPNSGKSKTWYTIFRRIIRTGWKKLKLSNAELNIFVQNSSFEETGNIIHVDVFIRNASFEEYGDDIIDNDELKKIPDIVFCSVQYINKGIDTINWFKENGYYLYIQWLNPGYKDKSEYEDDLKFEENFKEFGEFHQVSGKESEIRTTAIKKFLLDLKIRNE